jgi:hypothetical protein
MKQSALRTIALGTLIVGTLDILEVTLFYMFRGVAPIRIPQGIAAAIYGRSSFEGGLRTALVGLALHFVVACAVVSVYALAGRFLSILRNHPILCGALYGLAVHLVMSRIIVPMTAIGPRPPPDWPITANIIFAHLFCIGIPTGLLVSSRSAPASK